MNDEDIKQSLKCCSTKLLSKCLECKITKNGCAEFLASQALDLINRQQAEIERLNGNLFTISNACMQRRNEAIKEFEERLKKRAKLVARIKDNTRIWAVTEDDIDRVDAEMVGGENA